MATGDLARGLIRTGVHCYIDKDRSIYGKSIHMCIKPVDGRGQGDVTMHEFDVVVDDVQGWQELVTIIMWANRIVTDGNQVTAGKIPNIIGDYVRDDGGINTQDYERWWLYQNQ